MPSVFRRGSTYYTKFRTPRRFPSVEGRTHVVISLGTDSAAEARYLAPMVRARQEADWADLLGEAPEGRTARVIEFAQRMGRPYQSARQLAQAPLPEILERVEALPVNAAPLATTTAALLGGVPQPRIMASRLFEAYEELLEVKLRNRHKTIEQHRVWASARQRAVANFLAAIGDMPIADITRDHALKWREWHLRRVMDGKIKAESANKDFSNFGAMLNQVLDAKNLDNSFPFTRIRIKPGNDAANSNREPIPDDLIRSIILDDDRMAALNAEARDVLLVMLNTGARPSEIINLKPTHIFLDEPVPYIAILEDGREVKNAASLRDIPLVGVSREAMKRRRDGFPRYRGRVTSWVNLVNKYLRGAGLPRNLSAYGLRHAFSDRLTQANMTDRVICDAMGHGLSRERYGQGFTLRQLRDVLEKHAY